MAGLGAAVPAFAQSDAGQGPVDERLQPAMFDIAAQPLAAALERYSVLSKRQVIYNGRLAAGRQSVAVYGRFTPAVALQILLEGSGLTPHDMADDAFVLTPEPRRAVPAGVAAAAGLAGRYYGLIQARLLQSMCRDATMQPGGYRLAVSFWIGADGRLARAVLLDTTGAAARDAAIAQMLRRFSVNAPPPAGFAQPVTFVIEPRTNSAASECGAGRAETSSGAAP